MAGNLLPQEFWQHVLKLGNALRANTWAIAQGNPCVNTSVVWASQTWLWTATTTTSTFTPPEGGGWHSRSHEASKVTFHYKLLTNCSFFVRASVCLVAPNFVLSVVVSLACLSVPVIPYYCL